MSFHPMPQPLLAQHFELLVGAESASALGATAGQFRVIEAADTLAVFVSRVDMPCGKPVGDH
ncbi:hypothetical protein [Streptomyces sp. CA-106131]|uniref:hypothetical protein n=1 Tax=Streptomyces sp. CA-106131 TaxID=3240045 RepID=UPI003D8C6BB3